MVSTAGMWNVKRVQTLPFSLLRFLQSVSGSQSIDSIQPNVDHPSFYSQSL